MTDFMPEEQKDLYIRALRALNKVGRQSEHHKRADTKEEIELMQSTNRNMTAACFAMPRYKQGQFEMIFANPLSTTAYVHDLYTGECATVQAWQEPYEILAAFNRQEGEYIA